jgi:hypothetical protein
LEQAAVSHRTEKGDADSAAKWDPLIVERLKQEGYLRKPLSVVEIGVQHWPTRCLRHERILKPWTNCSALVTLSSAFCFTNWFRQQRW